MDRESFANRRACDTDRSAIERAVKRPRRAQTVTFWPFIQLPLIAPGITSRPDCACNWPPPFPCAKTSVTSMLPKSSPVSLSYLFLVSLMSVACYFGTICCRWALALRFGGVASVSQAIKAAQQESTSFLSCLAASAFLGLEIFTECAS